ncbi:hypothetical protein, partial [Muribaculum sp.]|uniref:hypothetical protein n=1 Tax=Muribaculum sp. TaxID=1918611 RepID=UPI0023D10080
TLLRHISKIVSSYTTLAATFIIKQAIKHAINAFHRPNDRKSAKKFVILQPKIQIHQRERKYTNTITGNIA